MTKKYIVAMLLSVFLVACGQSMEQEQTDISGDHMTENVEIIEEEANELVTEETTEPEEASASEKEEPEPKSKGALSELQVHYIDVGQADATLFQFADDEDFYTILFDTGDWRGNEVIQYLKAENVDYIDLVIVSHPDADHIGQLEDVVTTFDVGEVWLSGNESSSQTFQSALEAVLASGADYDEPRAGDEYEIGELDLEVLYPASITGASNEESISILFSYGDIEFLFTGDADKDAEAAILRSGMNVDADILHLGHHGSDTSSSASFIDAVGPEVAIYSAGAGNSYGHPSPEVVSLVQDAGIKLYGTDVHGTIIVTTDGIDYDIRTKEDGTISPQSTKSAESSSSVGSRTEDEDTVSDKSAASASCVNINEASIEDVQEIIHIGPARAQALVDLRPFGSVDDLERINGIGPARIKDIQSQNLACVQ
ncbi:MBL fold metallo-hydrolase [Oceanobacillus bengalensis]|uniref:MBL fold metallo-hydrolase n=1 Tax=Oceanobacillus bengalensis TaxID=1435466 RepID=A0A494YX45_9BACI|nr:MBL fold metallo-hydrolase [Oceanobacillus bengalensis]RKQ14787.1 MBL fold metallo-hydrolase [Oceanobacillus bengalensis]